MMVISSGSGLPPRAAQNQTEDDIHQCGACKKQFTDIFVFMRHKSESSCSSRPGKTSIKVTVPTSLLTGAKSISCKGVSISIMHPENKNALLGLLDKKTLNSPKNAVKNVSKSSIKSAACADNKVPPLNKWDSSWPAAKVLTNSLKQPANLYFVTDTEGSKRIEGIPSEIANIRGQQKFQGNLQNSGESTSLTMASDILLDDDIGLFEDDQIVEQFAGSPGVVLDVNDPEVARLLSSHLANDTLDIYPNTPETLLPCNSSQDDLDIQEIVGNLTFQSDAEFDRKIDASLKITDLKSKPKIKKQPKQRQPSKGPKIYKCPSAGCDFNSISTRDLARHQRTHSGEKPFKCVECDKGFTRPDHLQVHMRSHGESKQIFKCKLCDYSSKYQTGLVQHMRSHTNERRFRCPICNHSSRTKPHLNVHMKKHTGNNPFRCGFCRKDFTNVTELAEHMKVHSGEGEKPFSCQSCHLFCYFQSSLVAHIALNHNTDLKLECPICRTVCNTHADFQNHCKAHQDEPKHCKICDAKCFPNAEFNEHLKLHGSEKEKQHVHSSFPVQYKPSTKKLKSATTASKKMYTCRYCTETFYLQEAVVLHIQQHQLEELASEPVLTCIVSSEKNVSQENAASSSLQENMSTG